MLIPAKILGKKGNLVHDTGTSGFNFITNKKTWHKLAKAGAKPKEAFKVKSWKRQLTAFNIDSDKSITFSQWDLNLNFVTYIERASFMQHALMRILGMGGMIVNQLFMDNILILDCPRKKYSIISSGFLP